ncbi:hypothetical protein [Lacimicrobium alkaliphilum]|uniref:Rap1a immunity protein domain-containing protein n=1 Tax=Lacimicrobium alkaliphilum TaxID=1526571 RepID=A0ABQ1RLJ1_9ALTE|nr:hypothetical protein [Lacimicrobium alkaliphilum]GGD73954.1 hypothetical protein GCM10011357_31240 [Lacimicrobium alkaliphilum]
MNMRFYISLMLALLQWMPANSASALTVKQFSDICASAPEECSKLPVINAYIGGALDLLATLNDRTEYLQPIYCKAPQRLFDVPAIVGFMQQQTEHNAQDNAMLLLIRYLEEYGGCKK